MVMGDTHASSHGKVGQSSGDGDQGGDEVVETLGLVKQLAGNSCRKCSWGAHSQ